MKLFAPWFHARKTPLGTRKTRIFTLLPSPPAFNNSPDNESKRDAHPQDIGMSRPPHGGARESTLSQVPHFYRVSFSKRPFCQGIAPKNCACGGNTPTPLRGCYTLALPYYLFVACASTRVVKEQRRKIALVGVTPPHPQATALFLFHAPVLSRNSAEKFCGHSPLKFSRP